MSDIDVGWMRGRRAWVLTSGTDLVGALAGGLRDGGAEVRACAGDYPTQAAADARVAELMAQGAPDLVLISVVPAGALQVKPMSETAPEAWQAIAVDGLRTTLYLLRAVGAALKNGGAIVLAGPSLSLVGCPELVALSTLLEGQRGMVKSVARQWGSRGVTLNWLALAPRTLTDELTEAPLAAKPDAVSVALGTPPDPRTQVPPVLAFLASPAGRALTGATLPLDGGEWMVP